MIYNTSLGVSPPLFSPFLLFYQCPSHTNHNLVPTPIRLSSVSVNTDISGCFFFPFFFPSLPLSCCCSALLGMQGGCLKLTLMKTEGAFCLSAPPSDPVLSTLLFQQWRDFFSLSLFFSFSLFFLETCQQTALDRDMQMQSSEASQPSSPAEQPMRGLFRCLGMRCIFSRPRERDLISHSPSPESSLGSRSGIHVRHYSAPR